jgi:hypothetical protein
MMDMKYPSRSTQWFVPAGTPYLQVKMQIWLENGQQVRLSFYREADPETLYPEDHPMVSKITNAAVTFKPRTSKKDVEYTFLDCVLFGSLLFEKVAEAVCGSTWSRDQIMIFFVPENDKDVDAVVFHKDKIVVKDDVHKV